MMTLKRRFALRRAFQILPVRLAVFLTMSIFVPFTTRGIDKKNDGNKLVGLWKRLDDTTHALFLRKADGKFEAKLIFYNGLTKHDLVISERGHWSIKGNTYVIVLDYISNKEYRTSLHRPLEQKILYSTDNKFSYVSTDGVNEVEYRINDASDAAFEQEKLEPFAHLKP